MVQKRIGYLYTDIGLKLTCDMSHPSDSLPCPFELVLSHIKSLSILSREKKRKKALPFRQNLEGKKAVVSFPRDAHVHIWPHVYSLCLPSRPFQDTKYSFKALSVPHVFGLFCKRIRGMNRCQSSDSWDQVPQLCLLKHGKPSPYSDGAMSPSGNMSSKNDTYSAMVTLLLGSGCLVATRLMIRAEKR